MSKLKSRQIVVIYQLYTKMLNFNKILYKYLVNALLKLNNICCPSFFWIFTQEECENAIKKEIRTKHYVSSNNFTQFKKVLHNRRLWWLRHFHNSRNKWKVTLKTCFFQIKDHGGIGGKCTCELLIAIKKNHIIPKLLDCFVWL